MARPRKWASDAERMAANRAAKKAGLDLSPDEHVHAQGVPVTPEVEALPDVSSGDGAARAGSPLVPVVDEPLHEQPVVEDAIQAKVAGAVNKETLEEARAYGRLLGAAEFERTKSGHDYPGKPTRADRIARAEKYAEWAWREKHGAAA